MGLNNRTVKLNNSWTSDLLIGVEVSSMELGIDLTLVNVCGQCSDRVGFWNTLLARSYMIGLNLMVVGDLNFFLGRVEMWGPNARANPLVEFFLKRLRDGTR